MGYTAKFVHVVAWLYEQLLALLKYIDCTACIRVRVDDVYFNSNMSHLILR